jgi:hypothetical protein
MATAKNGKDEDIGASIRARLASQIVASVDRQGLTVREAWARTGTAAADFSRLRQGQLDQFMSHCLTMNVICPIRCLTRNVTGNGVCNHDFPTTRKASWKQD